MREIKFRAWDKKAEVMREIKALIWEENNLIAHCPPRGHEYNEWFTVVLQGCEYQLMQSTGLKDKNGVEIYVGDIVRHSEVATDISIVRFGEFGVPNIEEQSYQDCAVGFYYENASEFKDIEPFNMTVPLNSDYVKGVLVIGNIHENPELLSSGIE